jgi:hypothetical protein
VSTYATTIIVLIAAKAAWFRGISTIIVLIPVNSANKSDDQPLFLILGTIFVLIGVILRAGSSIRTKIVLTAYAGVRRLRKLSHAVKEKPSRRSPHPFMSHGHRKREG